MPEVRISLKDAALDKLGDTIEDMMDITGQSGREVVMEASYRLAVAIRARAKKGKKRRRVLANPEWKQVKLSLRWARARRKKGLPISAEAAAALDQLQAEITPYYIEKYWQGGIDRVPSYDTKDPRATIEDWRPGMRGGRGLAKGITNIVLARIATVKNNPPVGQIIEGQQASVYTWVGKIGEDTSFALRHINRLSYLTKAYPGIEIRALQAASNKMGHDVRELRQKLASKWEAAA
jgi:hypothetical protein